MRSTRTPLVVLLLSTLACAEGIDHSHHLHKAGMEAAFSDDAPIRITINPEARVSVTRRDSLLPSITCGKATEFSVQIVNQGFFTGHLEAELVGIVPAGVTLDFHPERLSGAPEEKRNLYITLINPDPMDLTIAFRLRHEEPDLGGRDRMHFLMRCL